MNVLPTLESGDQLSRQEFERRYEAMPWVKKAELIEGEVYMPSPVRWKQHACPHADFIWWLGHYRVHTPGVDVGDNGSIRLDMENEPQPDAAMLIEPACGGQVKYDSEDYVVGAPELTGEIAASSAGIDLHKKFRVYRRNEVKEYIVWRVLDRAIDWFALRAGQFERLPLSSEGYYQSEVFPGLWLDPAAMAGGELAKVLQVLDLGLAGAEHAAFIERLRKYRPPQSGV
ncbi:MAG TPA: Uma2 family endonuclease [Pirellulales bacterium]|jgi:Uma2 family endonuclease|nr:Uma2 family endonuclease [Pirellulales bacterium]